jgi:NAD(P)-dependent dehydrogenase (short-subunit alcohol dehydrogenase family)
MTDWHIGGLGSTTARLLRSKGAQLALLYAPFEASRREAALRKAFGEEPTVGISTHECDITSEQSVQQAFKEIEGQAARVSFPSILINAAGYVSVQPMEDTTAEEASKNILPNLLGPFNTSRAFYLLYQARRFELTATGKPIPPGRIVSISSQASHVALDGHSAYCASKAGLNGLTRCMANEWGPKGITANTVSPTVALTELGKKAWADDVKRKKHSEEIPTRRFSEPEEVAEAIEFLCRDGSGMINGADVRVDGGFTIR